MISNRKETRLRRPRITRWKSVKLILSPFDLSEQVRNIKLVSVWVGSPLFVVPVPCDMEWSLWCRGSKSVSHLQVSKHWPGQTTRKICLNEMLWKFNYNKNATFLYLVIGYWEETVISCYSLECNNLGKLKLSIESIWSNFVVIEETTSVSGN